MYLDSLFSLYTLMQLANADRIVTKLISVDFRSSFHYLWATYNEKQPLIKALPWPPSYANDQGY